MGEREVVESYARQFATFGPMVEQVRSSARSRLVWFVALAGFVILNGKSLWDPLAGSSFTGILLGATNRALGDRRAHGRRHAFRNR